MAKIVQKVADRAHETHFHVGMRDHLKGLGYFISDIKNCKSKEAEVRRVNREIANIRQKFTTRRNLDAYQKKKYIAKLLFIYLLGYKIEFGHAEAISLINSEIFSEKSIGYMFIIVVFSMEVDKMYIPSLISAIRSDIQCSNSWPAITAMRACATLCCPAIFDSLFQDVYTIFCQSNFAESVSGNCVVSCLHSMIRMDKERVFFTSDDVNRVSSLIKSEKLTMTMVSLSLLEELMKAKPLIYHSSITTLMSATNRILDMNLKSIKSLEDTSDIYYRFYQPWMLIKLLSMFRLYNFEESFLNNSFKNICEKVVLLLEKPHSCIKPHYLNMKFAILFEFISMCLKTTSSFYIRRVVAIITEPFGRDEPNLKGLALNCIGDILKSEHTRDILPDFCIKILNVLRCDKSLQVRRIAFDICYSICEQQTVEDILPEMINFVSCCPFLEQQDPALKIAILAEKFLVSSKWYVDTIVKLLMTCGRNLSDNVWSRVAIIITSNEDIQNYSCETLFNIINCSNVDENLIKLAAYVLGEWGVLISESPASSAQKQLTLLQNWFPCVKNSTKYLIITAFGKFLNLYADLRFDIEKFLEQQTLIANIDPELQQRVVETLAISRLKRRDLLATVFEIMPPYNNSSVFIPISTDTLSSSSEAVSPDAISENYFFEHLPNLSQIHIKENEAQQLVIQTNDTLDHHNNQVVNIPVIDISHFMLFNSGSLFQAPFIDANMTIGQVSASSPSVTLSFTIKNKAHHQIIDLMIDKIDDHMSSCVSICCTPIDTILPHTHSVVLVKASLLSLFNYDTLIRYYLKFRIGDDQIHYNSVLPLYPHHFILPVSLAPVEFIGRWRSLLDCNNECINVFQSTKHLDFVNILEGLRLKVLSGIDTNPSNICAAGGIYFHTHAVGILIRFEVNEHNQGLRLSIRSSDPNVSEIILKAVTKFIE